ncbi:MULTISPECIES: tRNA(His) guanylyltransferase Thg1 family protein [unclassified Mesorhizobium]|uniref:tRNA(His) guanylyltransferase Thg1 family protein n=1 Tax=unclassified Mesorhizobium TaxID=325217 RepID=UPI001672FECB|nr:MULTISPECIES: tRNA(His) guanylyltransferase Thg1 family protein [unclassified Mesorhizobium]
MDTLGDYLKSIEGAETSRRGLPGQAVYIRIDGNRFSKFTKGMERPFDRRMSAAMIETAKGLVTEFGAALGYTQSDEISLVLWEPVPTSELAHGGKFQKLASRTASKATHLFYRAAMANGLEAFVERQFPEFDSRAFAVSLEDAAKAIYWREMDARKNAIQMAARHHFSAKALHEKHADDQLAMLAGAGVDFDAFPTFFKRGTLIKRVKVLREMTEAELARIPEQYRPTGPIDRTDVVEVPMPELRGVDDRAGLLFA